MRMTKHRSRTARNGHVGLVKLPLERENIDTNHPDTVGGKNVFVFFCLKLAFGSITIARVLLDLWRFNLVVTDHSDVL